MGGGGGGRRREKKSVCVSVCVTPGQLVPVLPLKRQALGRAATGVPVFSSDWFDSTSKSLSTSL